MMAIERLARSRPADSVLAPIGAALDEMDRALRRRDLIGWAKTDERFHRTLVGMCGNARVIAMVDSLWDQGHRARMTTVHLRPALERSNEEHRLVVEAVRNGQWREACAVYRQHFARGTSQIVKLLEQTGLART